MKSLQKTLVAVAGALLFSVGSAAQAGVIIDLFQGAQQTAATSTLNATANNQSGPFAATSVLGQYRDLSIKKTFDNVGGINVGESSLSAGGGALQLDNATGNKSVGVVTWDGINNAGNLGINVNTTGLGGVDLTAGGVANAILTGVIAADLGFNYQIRVWDMDGNKSILSAGVQFPVNPSDNIIADYQFSWFNLANGNYNIGGLDFNIARTGLIDFTNIGALQLELENSDRISVDLAIGSIQTIPEPGVLALVGAGLFGVAVAGRRRKA